VPWQLPAAGALALGAAGFTVPALAARQEAAARRRDARHALAAFLDLVVISIAAGAGIEAALTYAGATGRGWAFTQIRAALEVGRLTRRPPWETPRPARHRTRHQRADRTGRLHHPGRHRRRQSPRQPHRQGRRHPQPPLADAETTALRRDRPPPRAGRLDRHRRYPRPPRPRPGPDCPEVRAQPRPLQRVPLPEDHATAGRRGPPRGRPPDPQSARDPAHRPRHHARHPDPAPRPGTSPHRCSAPTTHHHHEPATTACPTPPRRAPSRMSAAPPGNQGGPAPSASPG
jgi:hypothetical protein